MKKSLELMLMQEGFLSAQAVDSFDDTDAFAHVDIVDLSVTDVFADNKAER